MANNHKNCHFIAVKHFVIVYFIPVQMLVPDENKSSDCTGILGRKCHMTNVDDITAGCLATCNVPQNSGDQLELEMWIMPYNSEVFDITEISLLIEEN